MANCYVRSFTIVHTSKEILVKDYNNVKQSCTCTCLFNITFQFNIMLIASHDIVVIMTMYLLLSLEECQIVDAVAESDLELELYQVPTVAQLEVQ